MLSFSKGRVLGKIVGGGYNGKHLFINPEEENEVCCDRCSKRCYKRKCCAGCNMCCEKEDIGNFIEVDDGMIVPGPNIDTREVVYIAGPSGSGKTTYASNYISNYKRQFPDKKFIVLSRLDNDDVVDKLKPIRVVIDKSLVDDPVDITKELSQGGIVLFDDIDTIQDKKIKDAVNKLKSDILEIGRHVDLYCVITSHLINPNDKKDGRTILNECNSLTVFPKSGSAHAIRYALKNYFGFDNKRIQEILDLPSRWVTIYKNYPQCIMYEHGCYIPN